MPRNFQWVKYIIWTLIIIFWINLKLWLVVILTKNQCKNLAQSKKFKTILLYRLAENLAVLKNLVLYKIMENLVFKNTYKEFKVKEDHN